MIMNKWNLQIDFGEWLYAGIIERQGLIIFVPEIENQISNNCNINYAAEAQEYWNSQHLCKKHSNQYSFSIVVLCSSVYFYSLVKSSNLWLLSIQGPCHSPKNKTPHPT